MNEFIVLGTRVISLNYLFNQTDETRIKVETNASTRLLRKNSNPKNIIIEANVKFTSDDDNLLFDITTLTVVELNIDMSDTEINFKCLPLVFTAMEEKIRTIVCTVEGPNLELPPVQLLVENLLCKK